VCFLYWAAIETGILGHGAPLGLNFWTKIIGNTGRWRLVHVKNVDITTKEGYTKFVDTIKIIYDTIKEKYIDKPIYKQILKVMRYNCIIRRYEGFMINKSLNTMRGLISNLIFNIIKNKLFENTPPLFFLLPNIYDEKRYCYGDNYKYNDNFNFFYKENKFNPLEAIIFNVIFGKIVDIEETFPQKVNSSPVEILNKNLIERGTDNKLSCSVPTDINKVRGFNLDFNKTKLCLLTIINVTADRTTNNPPKPPYIKINRLNEIKIILEYLKSDLNSNPLTTGSGDARETIYKTILEKIKKYLIGDYKSDLTDLFEFYDIDLTNNKIEQYKLKDDSTKEILPQLTPQLLKYKEEITAKNRAQYIFLWFAGMINKFKTDTEKCICLQMYNLLNTDKLTEKFLKKKITIESKIVEDINNKDNRYITILGQKIKAV
jgi:hypothetical protein